MKTKQRPKSRQRNSARGQSCRINMHTTDGPPSNGGRSGVPRTCGCTASDNSPATKSTKDGRSGVHSRMVRRYTTDYSSRERKRRKERLSYTRRTVRRIHDGRSVATQWTTRTERYSRQRAKQLVRRATPDGLSFTMNV